MALKKRIAEGHLEDEIFEAVAEGLSVSKVCKRFDITSRKMFYDWKGKEGPRHDKYRAARTIAAGAHAELAGQILDSLDDKEFLTGPDVQAAVARSKYQQWLAGIKNRDEYGAQDKSAKVVLNFGELHFEALRNAQPNLLPGHTPTPEYTEYVPEADYVELETVGVGNDGEADAQSGQIEGPISPPAPALASELGELL